MKKLKNNKYTILFIIVIMVLSITAVLLLGIDTDNLSTNSIFEAKISEEDKLTGNKYVDETIKGLKMNTSTKIKETKNMNGIEIKISQLSSLDNCTTILGTLKNTSNEKYIESDIILRIFDDNGNELAKQNIGKAFPTLNPNQEIELNVSIINDFANAYDIKFETLN